MPKYDRDAILERVDLLAMFEEITGRAPRKEGSGWRAMCPSPAHVQSGKTPPVSIDSGGGLWHCHGCGAGGSAIDLLLATGRSEADAFEELARRAGSRPEGRQSARARPRRAVRQEPTREVLDELEQHVTACERLLWEAVGGEVLRWLRARGFSDELLRAFRIGCDPGPTRLVRARGLPAGIGAVFPVLDVDGRAIYMQLRQLSTEDGEPKYKNPVSARFGACPRVAVLRSELQSAEGAVLVCEGLPDALTVAGVGSPAVALLGTSAPDETVAAQLVEEFPSQPLVIALDADTAGATAADKLAELLQGASAGRRVYRLEVPETIAGETAGRDLNAWALERGERFVEDLEVAVAEAIPAGWRPVRSAAELLPRMLERLSDRAGALAIPTGFPSLDRLLADGGWRPGLILLGALPGLGKSALALQSAVHASNDDHPVLYLSVEQSEEELLGRMFSRELRTSIAAYWNRSPDFLEGVRRSASNFRLDRLFLRSDPHIATEDEGGTVGRLRRWAEEIAEATSRHPLVIVDYLQRMRPPEADRRLDERLRISAAGLALRQLARDLEVPVLVISSIGRGNYEGVPRLEWFKGSGDLEYDADACLLLRREDADDAGPTTAVELHVVKNRYGRLSSDQPIRLQFDREYGSFREALLSSGSSMFPPRPPRAA